MKSLAHLVLAIAVLGSLALRSLPDISDTYTVTTALDNDADGCGAPPADQCTLREAIDAANAHVGVLDTIEFNIPGGGVQTILPTPTVLPQIKDPVHINGYTQPTATEATEDGVAQLKIELDGHPYTEDVVILKGKISLRDKKPSRKFKKRFDGHTPQCKVARQAQSCQTR